MKFSVKHILRFVLALGLIGAGIGHLTFARTEFQAQVPDWTPFSKDFIVLVSGVIEIVLGLLLIFAKNKQTAGWIVGIFFVVVFPGNLSQYFNHVDAFGLNSDNLRLLRLFFQPVLVLWAFYCCGIFHSYKPSFKK